MSRASISYWLRGIHEPSGSLNPFKSEPSPELGYVIGVVLGDGNLNAHEYHRQIMLSVTDKDFAEEFSRCLAIVLGRPNRYKVRWSDKRKRWIVQGSSILLHAFLSGELSQLSSWIEHCERCEGRFLRGFYDGEGSVSRRAVTIHNTNTELLLYVQALLQRVHIQTTPLHLSNRAGTTLKDPRTGRLYTRKKDVYYFGLKSPSLQAFSDYVGFSIGRKQVRLLKAIQA